MLQSSKPQPSFKPEGCARKQKPKGMPPSREQVMMGIIQMSQQAIQVKNMAKMMKQYQKNLYKNNVEIKNGKIKQINVATLEKNSHNNFVKIKIKF